MAGNKIIEKIEEEARQGAAAIEAEAKQKAEAEKSRILGKAKESAAEIEAKAQADAKEAAGRLMLIADLKSRKDSLAAQRAVGKDIDVVVGEWRHRFWSFKRSARGRDGDVVLPQA